MRLLLFWLAACELPKPYDSTGGSDSVETDSDAESSGDDTDTDPDTGDDTSTDTGADAPSITWSSVLVGEDAFQDIQPGDPGSFYVTSARAEGQTGALWRIDDAITDLADAPMWVGSSRRSGFGVGVSSFELPGVGRAVATAEYNTDGGYTGRLLVALEDGATFSGVMADDAVIDIVGPVAGDGYSGGFFGYGATVWDGVLYATQTNAEPAVYSGTAAVGMSLADMAPVDGVSADPYPDGGQGYVANQMRSTGAGLLVCSAGGVCQHLDDGGADWYLYGGVVYEGQADLATLDRNVSMATFVTVVYGYYAVTVIGDDPADCSVLVLDDDGDVVAGDTSGQYLSIAAGEAADGTYWTAWGVFAYEADTPDETGLIYLVTITPKGVESAAVIHLPLERPYTCVPRLASDEVSTLAVLCYEGDYVMVGQVR